MSSSGPQTRSPHDAVIPWRMRRDLIARACAADGEAEWTLKDPLSLAYFRLCEAEYVVLGLLDGRTTYGGLLETLQRRFPGEVWSLENVKTFLSSLIQTGLVTSLLPGQGRLQAQRRLAATRQRRIGLLTSWLAIRWKGVDPEPLLNRIEPWTRWLFRPAVIGGLLTLIGFALVLIALRWETLIRRLPDAQTLLGLGNLLPLVLVFICIKLLHELGHVLTCRHFGGECHELGIQVLLFVPLFYGDVTDAWMLSRRWPRIAISAAGIFVELVLAAIATLLWWHSVPGVLNSIFLNVMLVCSVNTLLFNGNPLLRYDGYYVLADLWNLPNLANQARQTLLSLWEWFLTGASDDEPEPDSRRWWKLVIYGFASAIYRWFVLAAIVWFLHRMLGHSGLGIVATLMSVMIVGSAVVSPVRELVQRVRSQRKSQMLSPRRLTQGILVFALLVAAGLLIPWPYSVSAPFVVYPGDAQPVFVTAAGRIKSAVPAGSHVERGDLLGELANHELLLQHERQTTEVARLMLQLKHFETQRASNDSLSMRLPAARDALTSARRRLEQLQTEVRRLRITSPVAGIILPPPNVSQSRPADDELTEWHGTPLEPANQGATLRQQTLFCYVGEPARQDALLLVDQDAVEFVRVGQQVRLQFQSAPGRACAGHVAEIAASRSEVLPRELAVTHLAAARNSGSGPVPADVSYEVRVQLTVAEPAALYSPGRARIDCGTRSQAARIWRLLRHTFSAELSSLR